MKSSGLEVYIAAAYGGMTGKFYGTYQPLLTKLQLLPSNT